jgi:Fic-DOC domain mobile mystery protein B
MTPDLPQGTTPLDPDEAEGLRFPHVRTRRELDELEEANVQSGLEWARDRAVMGRRTTDVLSEEFLYELHRRMFGEVWDWAGASRRTDKNIGIDKFEVPQEVRKLIQDARHWREHRVYDADELAVRLHHRLTQIHPFPNGNGRHARMMADLVAQQLGRPSFSWGGRSLTTTSELRRSYIAALQEADGGDLDPLISFARS